MIKYKKGNVLDATENIIIQSVNHQGKMGAGLAKQIATKYPDLVLNYKALCNISFDKIRRNGIFSYYIIGKDKYIMSIFGQDKYGRDKKYTDYISFGNGLEQVAMFAQAQDYSIAIPSGIGAGLGGGDWDVILDIIENCFSYYSDVEVAIYSLFSQENPHPFRVAG
jgi:O-acetyl-ADP-ribose deacetylase (regulator of RNase III)